MKIKLILARTTYGPFNVGTEFKNIEVDIPLNKQNGWQVIGAEWPKEARDETWM